MIILLKIILEYYYEYYTRKGENNISVNFFKLYRMQDKGSDERNSDEKKNIKRIMGIFFFHKYKVKNRI